MTVQHAMQVAQKQAVSTTFKGTDRLLLGIVLSVITLWLFAQTTLNISPTMGRDLGIEQNWNNITVSFWSIGSWGGSGAAAVYGGFVAVTIGWRYIFWALLLSPSWLISCFGERQKAFDWSGLIVFIVALICLNIVIEGGHMLERRACP